MFVIVLFSGIICLYLLSVIFVNLTMDNDYIRERKWVVDCFNVLMKKPQNFYMMSPNGMPKNYYNMFGLYIKFYYEILYLTYIFFVLYEIFQMGST